MVLSVLILLLCALSYSLQVRAQVYWSNNLRKLIVIYFAVAIRYNPSHECIDFLRCWLELRVHVGLHEHEMVEGFLVDEPNFLTV